MQPMLLHFLLATPRRKTRTKSSKHHEHDSKPLLLPVYTSPVNSAGDDDVLVATRHEASTLELFFDLFLIANLSTFTATHSIVDVPSLVAYVGLLGILWFTWFQITLHDVRFAIDSMFQRVCKVIQFVIFVGFALVGSSFNPGGKEHNNTNFRILCYLLFISRLLLAIEYSVALAHIRKKSKQLTLPLVITIIVLILCAGSFYAMTPAFTAASGNGLRIYYVWYIILLVEVIVVLGTAMFWRSHSFKKTHLMERMGLLTLIVIGEGAIGITKTVGKLMGSSGLSFENLLVMCIVIILVFLWAMYFDNHPHYHYGTIRQQLWALLHFPLHCGIVGVVEGSQQIAIARYLFKKLFSIEKSIRQACVVENLDGTAPATALTTAVKALKLEDKAESQDQVAIILQDIYAVSNVTDICSATNITNLTSGVPFPEGFGTIVIDSFIGLFESSGINIPKDSDTETIARSTYETLYVYYWGSLFITVISFSVLLLLTRAKEYRPMIFERFAISARGVAAVIFVIMGATAGSQNAVYYLIKSPAILPMAAAILFLILCADRIGRQRSVKRQENSISHFDRNKDRSTYTRASDT